MWALRKDQLSWHEVHIAALKRLGGVPAPVRVDNEKTAIARGAGAWGEINLAYLRFAQRAHFHVDACPPRAPQAKGKVERRIGDHRRRLVPGQRPWEDLAELQAWTDARMRRRAERRICPATGTSALAAWEQEQPRLGQLEPLPRPFDVVVARDVASDCTVRFEGRTYSVPFALVGQ